MVHLPSEAELQAGLATLRAFIEQDDLLKSANISDFFLKKVLWAKHCEIKACKKLLHNYVEWHVKHLGSAAARLSVTQVPPSSSPVSPSSPPSPTLSPNALGPCISAHWDTSSS